MGEDSLPGMSVPVGRETTPLRNPWMVGEMTDSGAGAEQVAAEPEHCVPLNTVCHKARKYSPRIRGHVARSQKSSGRDCHW